MFAETDGENDLEWSSMGYGGLGNTMGFFNIDWFYWEIANFL